MVGVLIFTEVQHRLAETLRMLWGRVVLTKATSNLQQFILEIRWDRAQPFRRKFNWKNRALILNVHCMFTIMWVFQYLYLYISSSSTIPGSLKDEHLQIHFPEKKVLLFSVSERFFYLPKDTHMVTKLWK